MDTANLRLLQCLVLQRLLEREGVRVAFVADVGQSVLHSYNSTQAAGNFCA